VTTRAREGRRFGGLAETRAGWPRPARPQLQPGPRGARPRIRPGATGTPTGRARGSSWSCWPSSAPCHAGQDDAGCRSTSGSWSWTARGRACSRAPRGG